jgi:hypothetical protein
MGRRVAVGGQRETELGIVAAENLVSHGGGNWLYPLCHVYQLVQSGIRNGSPSGREALRVAGFPTMWRIISPVEGPGWQAAK